VKNERGVVYLEMLIGFLPVFMFFLGTLQVADASIAHLVVEHAATTAARAAVVVLPDDGAYYKDEDNAIIDEFRDYRQSDVERAADTILEANPRLDRSFANVLLDKPKYEEREVVTANVSAPYHCLVAVFCPGGLTITANAQLIYQGAHYKYEPSTGWASNAANRGLDNIRKKVGEYKEKKRQEQQNNGKQTGDDGKPDDEGQDKDKPKDDDEGQDKDKPKDDDKKPDDDKAKDDDKKPDDETTKPDDDTTKPDDDNNDKNDEANQKKVDDLRKALPPKLRDVPIKIDPDLPGSTVRVHYTHDDKGRITGIEVRVGPDAKARHIADHAATIKTMQRYQGVAGKARALVDRFTAWLSKNPKAGPGTLAWETKREVEKLTAIIENRQRQLDDPNLTDAERKELEKELDSYEKQLAEHEKVLETVTNEPGRGYVAARSAGESARDIAQREYGKDGRTVPDPPEGYHWSVDNNGDPIVVRDRVQVDGQEIPSRQYDSKTRTFPVRPDNPIPPRYRNDENAINGTHPATSADIEAKGLARQQAVTDVQAAREEVDRLARIAKIPPEVDVKSADGNKYIEDQIKAAAGDPVKLRQLQDLATARNKLTAERAKLTQASEQLGNQMAEEYMDAHFGENGDIAPGYEKTYPTTSTYTPGKSGEFDYVYTKGQPPSEIIIVEAKGASSDLGSANTDAGKASQGSPEYLRETARKMASKETDPTLKKMWLDIAAGKKSAPSVRYVVVKAPVDGDGKPQEGQVSEFDLTPRPDPSTNP
jgi:hypothetical protein